jgi:alkanesulfonate monooxygenase SsuD/methylene tetrahydromethanopterin reductase-like flavin-dependent oxidoreductase (luciferase family)
MTLTFHWFLPTSGDSRNIVDGGHGADVVHRDRRASIRYLRQIATAAEDLGFEGTLTPTGLWYEDAWLSTATLLDTTERLKFLVAFRPDLIVPTLAAQMAATFQNQSGGRLLLNIVTGGEPTEPKAFGDFLSKDERYQRTDEFLTIVRRLWERGDPFDFDGKYLRVEQARLVSVPDPTPAIYFGGSSAEAGPVAAARSDVYLTWGERPPPSRRRSAGSANWLRGRPHRAVRDPVARDQPGHLRRRLARGPAARRTPAGDDRQGPGRTASQRIRGPEADARPPRRPHRRSGDPPTSGPASASPAAVPVPPWSGPTTRSPSASRSTPTSASTSSSSPATPPRRGLLVRRRRPPPLSPNRPLAPPHHPRPHTAVPFAI